MTAKTKKTMKKAAKVVTKVKAKVKPTAKTLKPAKPAPKAKAVKTVKAVKAPVKAAPKVVAKTNTKAKAPVTKTAAVTKAPTGKKAIAKAAAEKAAAKVYVNKTVSSSTVVKSTDKVMPKVAAKVSVVAVPAMAQRPMMRTGSPTSRPATSNQHMPQARPAMASMHGRPAVAAPARPANDTPVDFRSGDYVVYPAHGVGTIEGIETQTIAGMTVTLYAITFEKDRMRLKIPVQKAQTAGLRKLSSGDRLKDALKTLQGKAKIKRTMWSRRAQEYEAKINSGDPVQIAEVLRDLRRPKDDTEQSYSERQIYQSALERLAREVAAVQRIAETKAVEHLETVLSQAA